MNAEKDVCLGCNHRTDQDKPAEIRFGKGYNPPHFCHLDYRQNPKSREAIFNTIKAGGEVCNRIIHAYLPKAGVSAIRLR